MSKINNGGPAFPLQGGVEQLETSLPLQGMSLRDYLAAKAMQGLLSSPGTDANAKTVAKAAYIVADAMLRAREAT